MDIHENKAAQENKKGQEDTDRMSSPDTERMMSEELSHLRETEDYIAECLDATNLALGEIKKDIISQKQYLWENIYEMKPMDIQSAKAPVSVAHDLYSQRQKQRLLLQKQRANPYFARIDFVYDGEDAPEALYIGLYGLRSKNTQDALIYDWRAPVAGMYYDFDAGAAYYDAPMGRITGKIVGKRQIKIKNGILEYVLSAGFKVDDELLQRELAGNASARMRNIAATIQKEQNSVIRDLTSPILLVQGAAGSGKTSVALHRIAFLLYQNRKTLQSSEVLILSPNHIFSEYISNVLPELGEENICEMGFDAFARHELAETAEFETKYEQLEYIINCRFEDDPRLREIQRKNSFWFLQELMRFIKGLENSLPAFSDYTFSLPSRPEEDGTHSYTVTAEELQKLYGGSFSSLPVFKRFEQIVEKITDDYETLYDTKLFTPAREAIQHGIFTMCRTTDIFQLYDEFIRSLGEKYPLPDDASPSASQNILQTADDDAAPKHNLLYEDVFPIILMKTMLFGREASRLDRIKHVVVDEMQDYSMVQYELLKQLFRCNMTILGDINQKMDGHQTPSKDAVPENSSEKNSLPDMLCEVFGGKVTFVRLEKSYRSTFEISEFCQKLGGFTGTSSFCRHGKSPVLEKCRDYPDMAAKLMQRIDRADPLKTASAAIICKTAAAAKRLYQAFDGNHQERCHLMATEDDDFCEGILITSSYLAKGLEFDLVIVPDATAEEYSCAKDRQILYIACTRALHELEIFYRGNITPFLDFAFSR